MREPLERLEKHLGHRFSNRGLLEQALTHRSAAAANNERLEFLGDSILSFIVANALFERHPGADEGTLTRRRATLVRRETLAALARSFNFGDYLILGPGELKSGGRDRDSILADALEATVGAIFLDAGLEVCQRCLITLFDERLTLVAQSSGKDAKTRLQERLQAQRMPLPLYEIVEVSGQAHEHSFRVKCRLPSHGKTTIGTGQSRRSAEQAAARHALDLLSDTL